MGKENKSENANFHQKAEELLKTDTSKSVSVIYEAEMLELIRELEVNQIELKIQNEELRNELIDRKRADESLLDSEFQHRTLVQTIPDLIWLKDTEGVYLSCNTRFERFFGATEADIIGKTDYDFVDRDLADFFRRNDRKAIDAGKPTSNEEWVTFADDGHRAFLDTIKTPIYDSDGTLLGILGIGRDITERKKAEDALLESEIKYRAFFENSMDAILLTSPDGKILSANKASCDMFGYSEDELIRLGKSGIVDGADSRLIDLLEERKRNGKARGEVTLLRKDGTRFPAEISSAIFKNQESLERTSMIIRDITLRIDSEKALRQSEKKFRSYIDNAPDGVFVVDETGRYIDVNNAACTISGYSRNEILRMSISDILAEESFEAGLAHFNELIQKGKTNSDLLIKHKDGSIRWWSLDAVKLTESRFLGFSKDITKRKQAETEIAMLAHSLKSINECVSITDLENKILFVNESFSKTYGYNLNELIGENISIVRSQANEQKIVDEILSATILGEWQGELLNRRKDGSEFPIYLSTTIIKDKDGNPLGLIGVAKDITERKKNEHEIKFQADLLNNVGQAVIASDLHDLVIYWNNAAQSIYGWSSVEAMGQNIISLIPTNPTKKQARELFENLSQGMAWSGEFQMERKDGSSFPAYVTDTPILDTSGELIGIMGISSDNTERKRAEQDLIIANKELVFQNDEKEKRAAELIIAKEKAEESDRLKSAFLANMSHEVRTPLNSIIGFSELLGDPDFEEDQKNEFIQHITASGNNLLTIISDIMDISKIESGEIKIRKSQINVKKFISTIREEFAYLTEEKKLKLGLNYPDNDEETIITADAERLRQIFNNLMSNAIKFTVTGQIEIGYQPKGKMVEFFIKDTGIGIPASYHNIIFDRFRKVEDEKNRKYGGNGLGLTITKNLVGLMGGKIWVDSNEGKGSTFYFTMPVN